VVSDSVGQLREAELPRNPTVTSATPTRPSRTKACPSAVGQEGALLLGVMTPGKRVAFVHPPTRIDAEFAARLRAEGRPEARFRFSASCAESGCPQWTGHGCWVVDRALDVDRLAETTDAVSALQGTQLPACGIRSSCRWFFQRGPEACAVCPLIVADTGGTGTYRSENAASERPLN